MNKATPTTKPRTTKQVVEFLAANGIVTELVRADGYLYFWGAVEARWYSSSVCVPRVSDLTLGQWLEEYKAHSTDYRNL